MCVGTLFRFSARFSVGYAICDIIGIAEVFVAFMKMACGTQITPPKSTLS
jgi:hypothetical protein